MGDQQEWNGLLLLLGGEGEPPVPHRETLSSGGTMEGWLKHPTAIVLSLLSRLLRC